MAELPTGNLSLVVQVRYGENTYDLGQADLGKIHVNLDLSQEGYATVTIDKDALNADIVAGLRDAADQLEARLI